MYNQKQAVLERESTERVIHYLQNILNIIDEMNNKVQKEKQAIMQTLQPEARRVCSQVEQKTLNPKP